MHQQWKTRAFTLVEILIVVVILGILAAIVIPQFNSARGVANSGNLVSQLRVIRGQIQLYRQHRGEFPPTLWDELLAPSNGDPAYLPRTPVNPFTGLSSVGEAADGSVGWVYDPQTGDFWAAVDMETAGRLGLAEADVMTY